MTIQVRVRRVLLVLPVTGELVLLAVIGIVAPRLIDPGITVGALTWSIPLIGGPATALLAGAAARCSGRLRLSWAAMATACGLWALSLFGVVAGWGEVLSWLVLRGGGFVAVGLALLIAPGVRRTAGEWGLLLLDGWLVGVSVFLIVWVALRLTMSSLSGTTAPAALYWVPFDLVIASTTAGLAVRARGGSPATVGLLLLGALLAVTSDTTWALTVGRDPHGLSHFGVVEWLIALTALASASLTRRLDVWSSARPLPDPSRPRLTRLAQMAMVPGLLAAATPGADLMTFTAAIGLILGLSVEVALTRRQHHQLWQALHEQAQQLEQLVRESRDAILRLDGAGRIEFANDAVADVFGHSVQSLVGSDWFDLIHSEDRAEVTRQLELLHTGRADHCRLVARFRQGDGQWRHLESSASRRGEGGFGYTLSVRDVSERNRLEADLRRQASTDWLTGLFNRQAFIALLDERLPRGDTHILFIDLDGFKAVNDTDGHPAGDRLLRQVADALRAELRPGDIAARFGGDEFAVLPEIRDLDGTLALAARLVQRIGRLGSRQVRIGASVGVAIGHHAGAEALIRQADVAMYRAKAAGGGRAVVFGPVPGQPARPRDGQAGDGPSRASPSGVSPVRPRVVDLGDGQASESRSGHPR
ncbi:MAG TPA: sensor domain-containing diguanylate cyclase [Kineosporiaceae bacterium]|nr:sensor domain-containing diguanylate cyclase [Kineosporiaceae bacterium]